jgi:Replication protein C N-terminal domain
VIGERGPVQYFELVRWARAAAEEHGLKPSDAHVLLLLVTFAPTKVEANEPIIVFPKVESLARAAGYRPTENSTAIQNALRRLAEAKLIWRVQGGVGRAARTELLYKPAAAAGVGRAARTELLYKPAAAAGGDEPPAVAGTSLPLWRGQKGQRPFQEAANNNKKNQMTPPAIAGGSRPSRKSRNGQAPRAIGEILRRRAA